MEDKIRIDLGTKRILINDGPEFLEFNPTDLNFAERFYVLIVEFENKHKEYQKRMDAIDLDQSVGEEELSKRLKESLDIMKETCDFWREQIDKLFGLGTSQKCFGDIKSLDMVSQFFEGITPYIQGSREEKISQFVPDASKKRHKRAAMK